MGWPVTLAFLQRHQEALLRKTAMFIFFLIALVPLGFLGAELLHSSAWARFFSTLAKPLIQLLFLQSLGLAISVTLLTLLIGIPLGILLAKTDIPGKHWLMWLQTFPMFISPFLLVLGWFYLFGKQGIWGTEWTSNLLFSPVGAVFTLTMAFVPFVTSLISIGLHHVDPNLEDAALVVAKPWRMLVHVSLPLVSPMILLAAMVVFSLSFSELGVPMFLRVPTYPAAIFARLGGLQYEPGEAFAMVLPLLGIALLLLALERYWVNKGSLAMLGFGKQRQVLLPLGSWRGSSAVVIWLVMGISLTPIAALMIRASLGDGWYQATNRIGHSLWNSLSSAGMAASGIVALGVILGHAHARQRSGSALTDSLGVLSFLVPASVLGVGLMAAWNHSQTQWLYGSMAIMVVGYMARYSVVGFRIIAAAVAQSSIRLEETAAAFGANFWRQLRFIILPLHSRKIVAAWLLTFIFCLRDLETVILFYPAGREPLLVKIFTLEANGSASMIAALSMFQIGMTAGILSTFICLLREKPRS
jgi:iron(III) transport system permease protein